MSLYPRSYGGRFAANKTPAEEDEGEEGSSSEGDKKGGEEVDKDRKVPEKRPGTTPAEQSENGSSTGTVRSSSSSTSASSASEGGETPPSSDNGDDAPPPPTSISKRSVPDIYPQVLALPITRRPLFPGFYKAVVIRNPAVIAAIKESIKRGQPYIGAFLLKDENADSDM